MPTNLQEWIALSLVALTIGFVIGRKIAKAKHSAAHKHEDCESCPHAKPEPQAFKNIPIGVEQTTTPQTTAPENKSDIANSPE